MSSYDYMDTELLAAFAVVFGIIFLVTIVGWILGIIGKWNIFTKAGKEGWLAIIPIYNEVVLCQISGVSPWWVLIKYLSVLLAFIPFLSILQTIIAIYFAILLYVSLARSFGKNDGWAVGLIFLTPFFLLATGVGKSEYQGAKPMDDFVFKNEKQSSPESPKKYCPNCNTEINSESKFCTNCGTEVQKEEKVEEAVVEQQTYCTNCNTLLDPSSNFCTNCGKKKE